MAEDEVDDFDADAGKEEDITSARVDLEARCSAAGLHVIEEDDPFEIGDKYLVVKLPAGRDTRTFGFWNAESIRSFLEVPFEKYVFLNPFEAICSYSDGTIEALLLSLERMPTRTINRLLLGKGRGGIFEEETDINISLAMPDSDIKVFLSQPSEDMKRLSFRARRGNLSLKLSGLSVRRFDDAVNLLRRVSDSLLFQIDTTLGLALNLARARRTGMAHRGKRKRVETSMDDLQFPTQEYDEAPMSLFWYAKSANGMPLLQFLAYYQVIEFYFPTYYQAEARRKIRRILKDPAFRPDRDADIGRVLSSLTGTRGTIGDERSMMRAVIQECVDPDELRGYFNESEHRVEFFSSKAKGLTTTKIPIANTSADLRNDVADRIYEIRCKIVHTKGEARDGEVELLLPFSKEADQLYYDIELIQYIAQRVLITASTPLRL